jgi:hypothetical protein
MVFDKLPSAWNSVNLQATKFGDLIKHGDKKASGRMEPYDGAGLLAVGRTPGRYTFKYPTGKKIKTANLYFEKTPTSPPPTTTPAGDENVPASIDVLSVVRREGPPGELYVLDDGVEYIACDITPVVYPACFASSCSRDCLGLEFLTCE